MHRYNSFVCLVWICTLFLFLFQSMNFVLFSSVQKYSKSKKYVILFRRTNGYLLIRADVKTAKNGHAGNRNRDLLNANQALYH